MRSVCRGNWAGNAHPLIVFRDDGHGGPDTDTICIPCRDAMMAKLMEAHDVDHLDAPHGG